jgi:NAD(P)-dependent dehydrogenase (short-subunit alcohol dehydrogenase family)
VDVLVNNLGIYESKPFGDIPDADWNYLFDVNVMSGVRLSRTYLPGMLERNWGRVVFISSESGLAIPQDMIHYATTKTAQLSVSRGLAQLTRGTNVTVNAVLPGPTRSEGIEGFLRSQASDPSASIKQIEAEFFATARSASILQRMVEAEEVANLVAYLASPRSSATNGAALRAEGGCLRYELHQSLDDSRVRIFVETWQSEAQWRAHMDSAAMQRFQASGVGDYFADFALHRLIKVAG